MKRLSLLAGLLFLLGIISISAAQDHLLISEFVVTPTAAEFIEIYNGTGVAVDLTNYYITDGIAKNDSDYINIVDGTYTPYNQDYLAKFPDGATIAAGEYLVIAADDTAFNNTYGFNADFELKGTSDDTPDMVAPGSNYIGSSAGLSNTGEVIILFYWDGTSDLVQDVDYVLWGDKDEAVDKTGVTKDGPDADSDASTYLADTPVADQISISSGTPHARGKSIARATLAEIGETATGGNGITGHDETSEDLAAAFVEADPTPGEPKSAGYVNVTFTCNTCAWRDTLGPDGMVQIRGTTITDAGQAIDDVTIDTLSPGTILTWNGMSNLYLRNVDGDYWKGTFRIPAGVQIAYKFFVDAQHDTVAPGDDWEHAGWEQSIAQPPDIYFANRGLKLTTFTGSDTVLPTQFANGWSDLIEQYEKPFTVNDSSFVFYVRVNTGGWEDFDRAKHVIGVRGSNMSDWTDTGEINWDTTYPLTRETGTGIGATFYSGAIHVPNQYATAGVKFKFVAHNVDNPLDEAWDDMAYNPDAEYEISTTGTDTTVYWKWFDNLVPRVAEHPDKIVIKFEVDLRDAVADRGFTLGDTIQVRTGYNLSASQRYDTYLRRQGAGTIYTGVQIIYSMVDRELFYQYYSEIMGVNYREVYFNFEYSDPGNPIAERRAITPASKSITISDVVSSISDPRRMPRFRNVQVISQDSIVVTLECDVRPAIYQVMAGDTLNDIQGHVDVIHPDSVLAWGVAVNGPLTGGWSSPGGDWGRHLMAIPNKAMHDDGLNSDAVKGDSIFSIQFTMYKDSVMQRGGPSNIIGQEFKFGIGGGDNEGGYGNNHIVNIDDSQDHYTIQAQFGSIDPVFYSAWDFDRRTGIDYTAPKMSPDRFALEQNFPNPFNPITTVKYSLAKEVDVSIKVYNTMGQEVKTLVDKKQFIGHYRVNWDGTNNAGSAVSTGLYFYKIKAGDFLKTRKMMLLK